MSYWYDRQGKVIVHLDIQRDPNGLVWKADLMKAEKLMTDRKYKVVKQQYTPKKKFWISTVWLGLDHDFTWHHFDKPNPRPVIFETMVFEAKESYQKPNKYFPKGYTYHKDFETERYRTEKAARTGHDIVFKQYTELEERGENW